MKLFNIFESSDNMDALLTNFKNRTPSDSLGSSIMLEITMMVEIMFFKTKIEEDKRNELTKMLATLKNQENLLFVILKKLRFENSTVNDEVKMNYKTFQFILQLLKRKKISKIYLIKLEEYSFKDWKFLLKQDEIMSNLTQNMPEKVKYQCLLCLNKLEMNQAFK